VDSLRFLLVAKGVLFASSIVLFLCPSDKYFLSFVSGDKRKKQRKTLCRQSHDTAL
jgi:hypothetical protein